MTDYIERIDNFLAPLADIEGVRLARVGGSVRDEILGRRVKDADYVVFGKSLNELADILFPFAEQTGAALSSLKLRDGRQAGYRLFKKGYGQIEIVLPRKEISTGPGHRDFEIVLDPDLTPAEDASRRDFTFNALYKWIGGSHRSAGVFADGSGTVIQNVEDPTNRGLYDLAHKLVHTTHPDSFRDDPLRTLRALRFVSTLGYDLSSAALDQMREHAAAVTGLTQKHVHEANPVVTATSGTVLTEMSKLLMGDDVVKALRLMRDTGVMAVLFPELAPMIGFEQGSKYHDLTTDEHTFTALGAAAKAGASLRVRWALLFHDAGKPETAWVGTDGRLHYYAPTGKKEAALRGPLDAETWASERPEDHEVVGERLWRQAAARMNTSKDLREDVATLIRHHMVPLQPRNAGVKVRRWRVQFGDELLSDLLLHRACDCAGKQASAKVQLNQVLTLVNAQMEARDAGVPASVKELQVKGGDVLALGGKGRQIGEILSKILDEVVCQPDERRRSRDWQMYRAAALL